MTESTITRTGVIGLGAMGLQMARHMVAKGFEVAGTDIDPDAMRRAAGHGVRTCASAAEVGDHAEIVILMVATDAQVDDLVRASGLLDAKVAKEALKLLEVDEKGFDHMDRKILLTVMEKFQGGPVGVETLSSAISEEKDTIEDVYEPFLIQCGFLHRTPRGRVATDLAYQYFGLSKPERGNPESKNRQETLF